MYGDEDKIRQAVRTLMDNAIRYMIDGGLIIIRCENYKQKVTFQVQDTGVGIPVRERAKIFQQFFRGSNIVRMRTDGTGLGLYIARAIINAAGGTIDFESAEGKGSTFTVAMPMRCSVSQKDRRSKA